MEGDKFFAEKTKIYIISGILAIVVVGIIYGIGQIVKAKDKSKEKFSTTGNEIIIKFVTNNWYFFLTITVILVTICFFSQIKEFLTIRNTPVA